jgi:DNA polymerase
MAPIPTSFEEAKNIVSIYRETNNKVVEYWEQCDQTINEMIELKTDLEFGPLEIVRTNLIMPNNMALQYPNLRMLEDVQGTSFQYSPELTARGDLKTRKYLWGGTLTENIVQALARIIITEQALKIEKHLDETYGLDSARIVHMVHDELIVIGPEEHANYIYEEMKAIMSISPDWAPDLPLECEGGFAPNYIK